MRRQSSNQEDELLKAQIIKYKNLQKHDNPQKSSSLTINDFSNLYMNLIKC